MKCVCGDSMCIAEVNFDSECGLLIAEGNPGAAAAGIYLDVAGAVALAQHIRAFILRKLDAPIESTVTPPERHR